MDKIILNGITWNHSRGITPLIASAVRFNELNPHIEVNWTKRSLQEFADFPIEKLVNQYDFLIIDHPWVGTAAATQCILPVDDYLSKSFLNDQIQNSVGYSHLSYQYNGKQWALAIDAATPTASYREDLFLKNNYPLPDTWEELLELAKMGKVIMPGVQVDLLMNFYMFCIALGEEPFRTRTTVVSTEKGIEALEHMQQLWSLCKKSFFNYNPIAVAEILTTSDEYWYCPFAYCYSNYSRYGFAKHPIIYKDLIRFKQHGRLNSTLGGTGLAISATTKNRDACFAYAEWISSSDIQKSFYAEHGGQPGHRAAWTDVKLNVLTNNYFTNILPALDRAYVRPRYHGYLHFQDAAGDVIQKYLMNNINAIQVMERLNTIYLESLIH